MSNNRRICVCGKERGKKPVLITITTCRHKHPSKGEDSICISTPPLAQSSPIDVKADSRSGKSTGGSSGGNRSSTHTEGSKNRSDESAKPDGIISKDSQSESFMAEDSKNKIDDISLRPDGIISKDSQSNKSSGESKNNIGGSLKPDGDSQSVKSSGKAGGIDSLLSTHMEGSKEKSEETLKPDDGTILTDSQSSKIEDSKDKISDILDPLNKTSIRGDMTDGNDSIQEEPISDVSPTQNETATEPIADKTTEEIPSEGPQENAVTNEDGGNKTSSLTENKEANNDTLDDEDKTLVNTSDPITTNEPTVMMLTETAVNTMPFMDNLFWSRTATKSMPNLVKLENNCTMELLVFEKHSPYCRSKSKSFRIDDSFFDGGSYFESVGRISFPTCTDQDVNSDDVKKESKGDCETDSEKVQKHNKRIFNTLETFLKNKQIDEALNKKSMAPFDVNLQKYITVVNDTENVKNLYVRKVTTDRSVQSRSIYTQNIKTPKWYDGFLICFGIKNNDDDVYYDDSLNNDLVTRKESSTNLLTKYLRM